MIRLSLPPAAALLVAAFCLAAPAARAQDAADILLRLDRLESANRQLTGQVEEARNQVRRLEDQLRRMQQDVDFRFQDLQGGKGGGAGRPASGPAVTPQGGAGATAPAGRRSDAFDPTRDPNAAGAPQQLGSATGTIQPLPGGPVSPGGAIISDGAPAGRGPGDPLPLGGGRPGPVPAVAAVPGASAPDELSLARGFLQRGDYELAEGQYREFLRSYPKDRLVPEAMFGLAETYFLRQRYQEAAEQYLNLSTQHPQAARAPDGLLKLAMSLRAIGERDQACGTLGEIGRKYPRTTPAFKQAIEREQKRSRC